MQWFGIRYFTNLLLDDIRLNFDVQRPDAVSSLFLGPEAEESASYRPIDGRLLSRLLFLRFSSYYDYEIAEHLVCKNVLKTGITFKNGRIFFWASTCSGKWFLTSQIFLYEKGLCPGIFDIGYIIDDKTGIIIETDLYIQDALNLLFEKIKIKCVTK